MSSHRCRGVSRALLVVLVLVLASACGGGGAGGTSGGSSGATGFADLAVTAFSAPTAGAAGGTYTVTGTITNQGTSLAAGISAVIYLSAFSDVTIDAGLIGLDVHPAILDPGESWSFSVEVDLPDNVANGDYYIGVHAPYSGEPNTANNTDSQTITISGGTSCTPDSYEADDSAAAAKPLPFGTIQTHNHCDSTSDWLRFSATEGETYGLLTSQLGDEAWTHLLLYDTDGQTVLATGTNSSLEFGASRLTWTAPATADYYVRAAPMMGTNSGGANTDYRVTLGDMRPDLMVTTLFAPTTGFPGGDITVHETVINQGFAAAGSFDVGVYLSTDADVTATDTFIGSRTVTSLAINASDYNSGRVYQVPATVAPGNYFIAAIADPSGAVDEFTTSNNTSPADTITVQAPATACTVNDVYEDDDTPGEAKPISVDAAAQSHNHCDDVADWVYFTAVEGQDYAIRLNRDGGASTAWIELFDPSGTTSLSGGSGTSAINWIAPSSANYLIKVGANSFGGDRPYTLKVDRRLPDLTETIHYVISSSVPAGGFLEISDTATNIGYLPTGPFTVGIYASPDSDVTTGDMLVATRSLSQLWDASMGASSNQEWYDAHFPRDLTLGTYYLAAITDHDGTVPEVSEANNTSTPITVEVTAPSCAWDAYEDDESPGTAKPIVVDETQPRNFCDDAIDWVRFTPSLSGMYVATGERLISVFQSDGVTGIEPHASSELPGAVSWAATAGETYYLKVDSVGGSIGGAYNFTVYQCIPDAFEDDDMSADAKAIASGEAQSRNMCEDADDWVRFNATAGTSYTIETTNANGGDYNVDLTLYDTDGATILVSGSSAQGGKKEVINNWTAPSTGTYYLRARPRIGTGTFAKDREYTLSLN